MTPRPWYREPWPWILIAIPALAVVGGAVTLWLALSHPDALVLDVERYQKVRAELQAQPVPADAGNVNADVPADGGGER